MDQGFEATRSRRRALTPDANPRQGLDYLVTLEGEVGRGPEETPVSVCLRFVPDSYVLRPDVFAAYLASLTDERWATLEALGADLLGDIDSELLPRWAQVCVATGDAHRVALELRQPGWENRLLMVRIPTD